MVSRPYVVIHHRSSWRDSVSLLCNICHPRIKRSVQSIVERLPKVRHVNLPSPGPEADLVPGSGGVWRAWRPPGECPRCPAKATLESDCQDGRLPSLDWLIKPGCESSAQAFVQPVRFDLDLILKPFSQISGSAYEWSDGTKPDYEVAIADLEYQKPGPSCVFLAPGGAWTRTSCSIPVDGAICYNTTVTTASQRKTPSQTGGAQHP